MKSRFVLASLPGLLLLGLAGCTSQPTITSSEPSVKSSISQQATSQSATATHTPVVMSTVVVTSGLVAKQAPPYDEIRQRMEIITKKVENPQGPEMNDDGIVDPQIKADFEAYYTYLQGMKVEGWQGWLYTYGQADIDNLDAGYHLGVFMQEPSDVDSRRYTDVLLRNVPLEQVKNIDPQITLHPRFNQWKDTLPRVVFSGTILSIQVSGRLFVEDVELMPPSNR